ncbi:MAG: TetR/AcrR family transcriptional regulator [Deltaproteobacteria bacterium]
MNKTNDNHHRSETGNGKSESTRQDPIKKRQLLILKKASKLFIKKGYSQTTMRDISKATGINLGNLYSYISSKEDILCLSFDTYHGPAMDWFEREGIFKIEDPEEQLRIALRQMLEMIHDVMNDVLMMYRETRVLPPKFLKIVLKKENDLIKIFEDIIARGVEKKIFNVRDPFFAANMLVFQLSLYPLRSWNLKRYTREEYLDLAQETILRAVIPQSA